MIVILVQDSEEPRKVKSVIDKKFWVIHRLDLLNFRRPCLMSEGP